MWSARDCSCTSLTSSHSTAPIRSITTTSVERELNLHDPRLATRPRVLTLSKADLLDPAPQLRHAARWSARLGPEVPVILTSAVNRCGARRSRPGAAATRGCRLAMAAAERVGATEGGAGLRALAEHRIYRPAADAGYEIEPSDRGSWRVSGPGVARLVARYDLDNDEALAHLERRLGGIGVVRALARQGFSPGTRSRSRGWRSSYIQRCRMRAAVQRRERPGSSDRNARRP